MGSFLALFLLFVILGEICKYSLLSDLYNLFIKVSCNRQYNISRQTKRYYIYLSLELCKNKLFSLFTQHSKTTDEDIQTNK